MLASGKYSYSRLSLAIITIAGFVASWFYVWKNNATQSVNFIVGDAEFYYYYLQSVFVDPSDLHYDWFKAGSINTITHHPIGLSVIFLPFYLAAQGIALLFGMETNGITLPYQLGISLAGLASAVLGCAYLLNFLKEEGIGEKAAALTVLILYFGTTLFQYSIIEPGMSHVYSFCFISIFLYYASQYRSRQSKYAFYLSVLSLGMVLLIRPNNILVLLALPFLFRSLEEMKTFLKNHLGLKRVLSALGILAIFALLQVFAWYLKEEKLFSNRYAPYGFNWLHPHWKEMLFGFEAGFFIYTPMCLLFLFGLISIFRENRFRFYALGGFILFLIYFFSSYSAYTYFDGLGIRVLVDYYAVFAYAGAKLLDTIPAIKSFSYPFWIMALFFLMLNLVYSYQSSRGILLRSGMNFNKWKYVFMRTGYAYRGCLGGSNEYAPYAVSNPGLVLSGDAGLQHAFDYTGKEFGVLTRFDSVGVQSKRLFLELDVTRREPAVNSSSEAMVCVSLGNKEGTITKAYTQFRLNETPSNQCCVNQHYHYTSNLNADFQKSDRLSVYIWNKNKQNFSVSRFAVKLYDFNQTKE
ncbi:MAG TPA: hypothetical protein PLQ93_09285 [Bacteroidia bacterium]|nr:hypothetical protein [Bacteroidia bacterium]